MPRISQPRDGEPIRLVTTRNGSKYRVVIDTAPTGSTRKQVTRTFPTLTAAREFVTETRQRLAEGTFTAPSRITLRELATVWLTSRRDVREVTVKGYKNALRPALDQIGDRHVQSLTRRDVEALVEWAAASGGQKGTGLAQRSIVYLLVTLRMVLDYGVRSDVLHTNVAVGVKPPRRKADDRKPRTVWTVPQMVRFRTVADRDGWAVGMRLILCGLRRSEVCGLRWDHVDLDAGTITVAASRVVVGKGRTAADDPKSAASARTVPVEKMHPGTTAMLRTLRTQQAADRLAAGESYAGERYVVADALGQGVHPDALTARWRTLCGSAGVPVVGTHSVRHTLATVLHQAGEAPADVAALLGHEVGTHLTFYVQRTEHGAARAAGAFAQLSATAR